jgi:hypothetical protein
MERGLNGAETRPSAAEGEAQRAGTGVNRFQSDRSRKSDLPPLCPLFLSHRFNDDDGERPLLDLHIKHHIHSFEPPRTLRQPDWPIISTTHTLTRYRHHIPLFSTRSHRPHSLTSQQIALPNYILTPLQDETTIDIKNQTTTARPLDIVHYVS